MLKVAGEGSTGSILSKRLEASNVDSTEILLNVQDLSHAIQANARVLAVDHRNAKAILNETQG